MRKVDWNRTRFLLAFAILSSAIGFGGYAASTAQEPTPAKEAPKAATPQCGCKKSEATPTAATLAGYQTCPFYCYATIQEGETLLYYHYAIRYLSPSCEFDGLSMLVLTSEVNANGACGGEHCASHSITPRTGKSSAEEAGNVVVRLPEGFKITPKEPCAFSVVGDSSTIVSEFFVEVPLENQDRLALVLVKQVVSDPGKYSRTTNRPPHLFHVGFEVKGDTNRGQARTLRLDRKLSEMANVVRFEISGVEYTALVANPAEDKKAESSQKAK